MYKKTDLLVSQILNLRQEGKSYREIAQILGLSRKTVSRWCHGPVPQERLSPLVETETLSPEQHLDALLHKTILSISPTSNNIEDVLSVISKALKALKESYAVSEKRPKTEKMPETLLGYLQRLEDEDNEPN